MNKTVSKYTKTLLAATIATSSAITLSALTETTVSAADYTQADIEAYLDKLYAEISKSNEHKQTISTLKAEIQKVKNASGDRSMDHYIGQLLENNNEDTRLVLGSLIGLMLEATSINYKEQVAEFKSLDDTKVKAVFGPNVSNDLLIEYAAQVLGQSYSSVSADSDSEVLLDTVLSNMQTVGSESNGKFSDIYKGLQDNMYGSAKAKSVILSMFSDHITLFSAYNAASKVVKEAIVKVPLGPVPPPPPPPPPSPGPTPPLDEDTGAEEEAIVESNVTDLVTNLTSVLDKISQATNLTTLKLNATGKDTEASIPTEIFTALSSKNKDAKVLLSNEAGSYSLPVAEVNIAELAKQLGVNATDVKIKVVIKETTDTSNALGTLKAVAPILEFEVVATGSGKSVSIVQGKFSKHVERTIVASAELNAEIATAVRLNEDGTLTAIPTIVDGKTVTLKSLTNSKYTVISEAKTFADVDGGKNWAEEHVEKLASKLIIKGKSATKYAPKDDMTRAEFAALLSRSLGLVASSDAKTFADVPANLSTNANKEIDAAAEAGIIKGYEDGKFRPNGKVTRVEAAIMMNRAMNYLEVSPEKTNKTTIGYKDTKNLPTEYVASVITMHEAGIMTGFSDTKFGPRDYTKRDQMAKMLDQFLQSVKFGN